MRRVVLLILMIVVTPAPAVAEGRDVFLGILQGVLGEMDRQQAIEADRERQRAAAAIRSCFDGDEAACQRALQSPRLNAEGRYNVANQLQAIRDQRAADERAYQVFTADWTRCRDGDDIGACDAALAYPHLSDSDHRQLLAWRQAAEARVLEQQRHLTPRVVETTLEPVLPSITPDTAIPIVTASIDVSKPDEPSIAATIVAFVAVTSLITITAWWMTAQPRAVSVPGPASSGEPPPSASFAASPVSAPRFATVEMTGHFPTDVRRVLEG